MVSDGFAVACDLHCHFLCVFCEESGSPVDERQTRSQLGTRRPGVRFTADIVLPVACSKSKLDKV